MNGTRNALKWIGGKKTKKWIRKFWKTLQELEKKLCLVFVANVVRDQIALSGSIVFLWAATLPPSTHPPPNLQLANCSTFLALDR